MSEINNSGRSVPDEEEANDPLAAYADILKPLREKHGEDLAIYPAPRGFEGIMVFGPPPNDKVHQNYTNNMHNDRADKAVESLNYALACCLHPARAIAKAMFAKKPGMVTPIANRCAALAGNDIEELGKG